MKNFKKILFSFILICTFFCFSKNVLADTTCTYTIYSPFDSKENNYIKATQYSYMNYFYRRVLNQSLNDFNNYNNNIKKTINTLFDSNLTDVNEIHLELVYKKTALFGHLVNIKAYNSSGKSIAERDIGGYSHKSSLQENATSCPIIAISEKNQGLYNIKQYDFKNNDANELIYSILTDDFFEGNMPVIFMNDELKLATGGIMYVNQAYNVYFNDVHDEYNIDPIVEKYLRIPNFKSSLDELNKGIDSISNKNNIGNDTINNQSAIINELVASITNLDEIPSDLKILKNFNSVKIGNTVGLRNILNSFLEGTGEKAGSWFEKYMQDSKAKYVDALIMVLEMIENNDDIKNLVNFSDKINESYKDYNYCLKDKHTAENCIEECKAYYTLRAEYECLEKSSGSNYNACISSYPNPSVLCKNKSASDIQSEIASTQNDVEESIKDSISKKIVELYENQGINIGDNDFCSILLGEGKNDGLYPYIRLVLNLIRIAGPILVVLLTAFDGMKVITSFKGDENKKFWNHLKIRLICLVILILVPTIINYIVNLFISSCPINV